MKCLFLLTFFSMLTLFSSLGFAQDLEVCGLIGEINFKKKDCFDKNSHHPKYQEFLKNNFKIQTVNSSNEIYLFDEKTGLSWSPEFDRKKKCRKPYKKARKRHYKKVSDRGISRVKKRRRCIADLDNWIAIPNNRYLYNK